jgi:hypothetical protein
VAIVIAFVAGIAVGVVATIAMGRRQRPGTIVATVSTEQEDR